MKYKVQALCLHRMNLNLTDTPYILFKLISIIFLILFDRFWYLNERYLSMMNLTLIFLIIALASFDRTMLNANKTVMIKHFLSF